MKLFLNGGGSTKELKLTMIKLNEIIDHSKPMLYVPLAMEETEHPYDSCYEWFQKQIVNVNIPCVDMPRTFEEFASKNFENYSAIFIGGGNTYKLLKGIKDNGIFEKIIEYLDNDGIVIGCSAGAIIFGYDINSCLVMDENDVNLEDTKGFNVLNGKSIFAHYTNEKNEETHTKYTNYLTKYSINNEPVIALPEEDTIFIDNDKTSIIGHKPYYEFENGEIYMYNNIPNSINKIIANKKYNENNIGKTYSKVYIFDDMVLKIQKQTHETINEVDIIQKVSNNIPVPKIIEYVEENGFSYTLMSRIKGNMLCNDEILRNPKLLIKLLSEGLKLLWSVDINECPIDNVSNINKRLDIARYNVENNFVDVNNVMPETFGPNGFESPKALLNWLENNIPDNDLVFSHGDYCLENIFYSDNHISGLIDLGKSGVADRWQDLAICIRELDAIFSNEYVEDFDYSDYSSEMLLNELGIEKDNVKLKYYMLLDELF